MSFADIQALSELLASSEEAQKEQSQTKTEEEQTTPSTVASTQGYVDDGAPVAGKKASKDIWDVEADEEQIVDEEELPPEVDDGRRRAKYEVVYKQAVGAEDMYLGMSGKTPGSNWCEQIVVKVTLPETERASEVNIDVKAKYLAVDTAQRKARVALPKPVDPEGGSAQWDAEKKELRITLDVVLQEWEK